jgi:PKD repeat protein
MAVVADFIASSTLGPSPLFVTFWDTSTGGPDSWLWDFGDGNVSTDHNPTHTYTGETGDGYTVTLTAWISATETTVPMSEINDVRDAQPIIGDTNAEADALAFADLMATGWNTSSPTSIFLANFALSETIVEYRQGKRRTTSDVTLLDDPLIATYIYETWIGANAIWGITITNQYGNAEANVGGKQATISGVGDLGVWTPTIDLSSLMGTDISVTLAPVEEAFGSASVQTWTGIVLSHRIQKHTAADADSISKKQEAGFITIGVLSENAFIDFVGVPRSGTSPLDVQFTDLSEVNHAFSVWNFGDGNFATFAGETHPANTYTTDGCSLDLL